MEQLINQFIALSPLEFYLLLGGLIFITCSGCLPNNNDVFVAAGALITQAKNLPILPTALFCFTIWFTGETLMFLLGKWLGSKLLQKPFILKKFSKEKQLKFFQVSQESLTSIMLSIRISPFLRGYTTLLLGALGVSPKKYIKMHFVLLFTYSMILFNGFYFLGDWLKNTFSGNPLMVIIPVVIIWMILVIRVGRKFWTSLSA